MRRLIIFVLTFIINLPLFAQFYLDGNEDGCMKWSQINTQTYQVIYPMGLDSLGRVYAQRLQNYWSIVGNSVGYKPNQEYSGKFPVILRVNNVMPNGSVVWAPKRMTLFTVPQAYNPSPMSWSKTLAVHESRHVAQLQFGNSNTLKYGNWIIGQIFTGAMSAVYPNLHLLEGDAVATETALTKFGRGRESDFLNYYRLAFSQGDYRNWYRWRYGSFRTYSPNYYALGYLTVAGTRYFYDDPLWMKNYFESVSKNPFQICNLQSNLKKVSQLSFNYWFKAISFKFKDMWEEEAMARAPFLEPKLIVDSTKFYTSYKNQTYYGKKLYALMGGYVDCDQLVEIVNGKPVHKQYFSNIVSNFCLNNDKLWWSEGVSDVRWSMDMSSEIKYLDLKTGKTKCFSRKGRFFNPYSYQDKVVVVEYPKQGGSNLVVFNTDTKKQEYRYNLPDSLQIVQVVEKQGNFIFSAISEHGVGLYALINNNIVNILEAQPVSINDLQIFNDKIYFDSDRTGVFELYNVDFDFKNIDKKNNRLQDAPSVYQLTSLRYGGQNFCFSDTGDTIVFSGINRGGNYLYMLNKNQLSYKKIDYTKYHKYKEADALTQQEKDLASSMDIPWADSLDYRNVKCSKPKPYAKYIDFPKFHSWLPFYVDLNSIQSAGPSMIFSQNTGWGATVFFQNNLGTISGSLGYLLSAKKDNNDYRRYIPKTHSNGYRSSIHLNLTYSGFYPIINFDLYYGQRQAIQYFVSLKNNMFSIPNFISSRVLSTPFLSLRTNVSLPFNFTSSGWVRGIVGDITYNFSNDAFEQSYVKIRFVPAIVGSSPVVFDGYNKGNNSYIQLLTASIRAYAMTYTPNSCAFPKWGIILQTGMFARPTLTKIYSPFYFVYALGYVPGFMKSHGMRFSVRYQSLITKDNMGTFNNFVMVPRGFVNSNIANTLGTNSVSQLYASLDYNMPLYFGDISFLSPVMYIKNFNLRPHIDYCKMWIKNSKNTFDLYSIGSEFSFTTANFAWIPFPMTMGMTFSYNILGSSKKGMSLLKNDTPSYVGFIFRMGL